MADFNLDAVLQVGRAQAAGAVRDLNRQLRNVRAPNVDLGDLNRNNFGQVTSNINRLSTSIEALNANYSGIISATKNASQAQGRLNRSISQGTRASTDFADSAALALRRFAAFSFAAGGAFGALRGISSNIRDAILFERELLRVTQVTRALPSDIEALRTSIGGLSIEFGAQASELVSAAKILSQAGFSVAEVQNALQAVAASSLAPTFNDLAQTTEALVAITNQFGISSEDLGASLGQINAVAAQFAVEADDIVKAVQRAGGVFAASSRGIVEGNDALAQFIALFTSVRATTRESAETIATGIRTITARLQRPRSLDFFRELGIELSNSEGQFVGTFEAIQRIGQALTNLPSTDTRFAQIVEQLGGFRQVSRAVPLITETAKQTRALNVALQGQESISRDAAIAQRDLFVQYRQTVEQISTLFRNISNSDSFQLIARSALQAARAIATVADSLSEVLPLIAAIGAGRGAFAVLNSRGARSFAGTLFGGSRRQAGGTVPGTGSGDKVPILAEPGEFVLNKKSVQAIGLSNVKNINQIGRFQNGGEVTRSLFSSGTFRNLSENFATRFERRGVSSEEITRILNQTARTFSNVEDAAESLATRISQLDQANAEALRRQRQAANEEFRAGVRARGERLPGGGAAGGGSLNIPVDAVNQERANVRRRIDQNRRVAETSGFRDFSQGVQNNEFEREERRAEARARLERTRQTNRTSNFRGFSQRASGVGSRLQFQDSFFGDSATQDLSDTSRLAAFYRDEDRRRNRTSGLARGARRFGARAFRGIGGSRGLRAAGGIGAGAAVLSGNETLSSVGTGALGGGFLAQSLGLGPIGVGITAVGGALGGFNQSLVDSEKRLKEIEFEKLRDSIGSFGSALASADEEIREAGFNQIRSDRLSFRGTQEGRSDGGLIGAISRSGQRFTARDNLGNGITQAGIDGAAIEQNIISQFATLSERVELGLRGASGNVFTGQEGLAQLRSRIRERGINAQARQRAEAFAPSAQAARAQIEQLIRSGRQNEITTELRTEASQDFFEVQRAGTQADGRNILGEDLVRRFEEEINKEISLRDKITENLGEFRDDLGRINDATGRVNELLGIFSQELAGSAAIVGGQVARAGGNFNEATGTRINPFENIGALSRGDLGAAIGGLQNRVGQIDADALGVLEANIDLRGLGSIIRENVNFGNLTPGSGGAALTTAVQQQLGSGGILSNLPDFLREAIDNTEFSNDDAERFVRSGDLGPIIGDFSTEVEKTAETFSRLQSAVNQFNDQILQFANQRSGILNQRAGLNQTFAENQATNQQVLRDLFGGGTSVEQAIQDQLVGVRAQTGGTANPFQIADNIAALEGRRAEILDRNGGNLNQGDLNELSVVNSELQQNSGALKTLTREVVGLQAVQSRLQELEQRRLQAQGIIQESVFASAEDRLRNSRGAQAFQAFNQGGFDAVSNRGLNSDDLERGLQLRLQGAASDEERDRINTEFTTRVRNLIDPNGENAGFLEAERRGAFNLRNQGPEAQRLEGIVQGEQLRQEDAVRAQAAILDANLQKFDETVTQAFVGGLQRLIEAAEQFRLPENIEMNVQHSDINVRLNGSEVLSSIQPLIEAKAKEQVDIAIAKIREGQSQGI